jgi:hypothetical protein
VTVDESLVARAGIERFAGRHLVVYSDLRGRDDVELLPNVFDAAVGELGSYFAVSPEELEPWRLAASVMLDRSRFVQAGLAPNDLPDFLAGYQRESQIWVYPQTGDYYLRHLVLHEGVHAFMTHFLGGTGPAWYSEGIAELLGLHHWNNGQLTMAFDPPTRDDVPYWGRVRLLREAIADGRAKSLGDVFALQPVEFRQVESYAWAWAACKFLSSHPLSRQTFENVADQLHKPEVEIQVWLEQQLEPHIRRLNLEWSIFLSEMDYGYLVEPMAIRDAETAVRQSTELSAVEVDARFGWQRTTWTIEVDTPVTIAASGEFQIANDGGPWPAQANGVTIEYHQGFPLGRLIACVMPGETSNDVPDQIEIIDVGSGATLRSPRSGVLWLRLNDSPAKLEDNSGKVRVSLMSPSQ